eukprot:TRINITY_DN27141_c0_g1_i1.p1 TRINITY_DN27141_c0_g1~~TRINITY_DN27141_c0_g1_i1.p1  ORF type:complete len:405 (+),score=54.08 TRINITY_DN27141_c0_g1_i1:72-1286(+)
MSRSRSPDQRYRLWAGGLPNDVTEEEVRETFAEYGQVTQVFVRSSFKDTFAFVQYNSQRAIDSAIEGMKENKNLGTFVNVQVATPKDAKFHQQGRGGDRDGGGGGRGGGDRYQRRSQSPGGRNGDGGGGGGGKDNWRSNNGGGKWSNWKQDDSWYNNDRGYDQRRGGDERDSYRDNRREAWQDDRQDRQGNRNDRYDNYEEKDDRWNRNNRDDHWQGGQGRGGYGKGGGFDNRRPQARGDSRQKDRGYQGYERSSANSQPLGPRRDMRGGQWSRGDNRSRSPHGYGGGGDRGRGDQSRNLDGKGDGKGGRNRPGRHRVTVENLPDDMTWDELKELAEDFGPSVTFARTFKVKDSFCGELGFEELRDAEAVVRELDNRRVEGSSMRLAAYVGHMVIRTSTKNNQY